jgi:hypothetical protein
MIRENVGTEGRRYFPFIFLLVHGVALALERRQLLRHEVQVRSHLVLVVAAELAAEDLPLDVHGRDFHAHTSRVRVARSSQPLKRFLAQTG